jgi:hypothetical protein
MVLSEESQILVLPSFVQLYIPEGRVKPIAPRDAIAARHEVCEDVAQALTGHARATLWGHGVTEQDVMDRVLAGLLAGDSGLTADEAMWVARRLAELLEWQDVWL